MRKLIAAFIIALFTSISFAETHIDPEQDTHDVLGGLYSLAAAVSINESPSLNEASQLFTGSLKDARILRTGNAIWVCVPVDKYSRARHYLRDNSEALGITESPEGYAWIGGDDAWLKACDIVKGKMYPIKLKAARGSGSDSNVLFLSTEGQTSWWQMNPSPKAHTVQEILTRWGIKNAPELHRPSGEKAVSIFESVRPSEVQKKPADMHVGLRRSSLDVSVSIGDVIFDPIPNVPKDVPTN